MTKLEKEINRIREENKVHLAEFEKWLNQENNRQPRMQGVIKQSDDYNMLCETIKLDMPEWLKKMEEVEKAELNW
jgi:rubrerythrin